MIRQPIIVPRKFKSTVDEPYGYIYITTNLVNNKKYLGQHKPSTEGNYKGSGTILLKAFDKYGKENFVSEPIDWAESKEKLDQKEIWWIDFLGAVESDDWYNISVGGNSVALCGEQNPNYQDKSMTKSHHKAHSEFMKNYWKNNPNLGMTGKHHTQETRKKMSKNHADFSGKNHPMYGVHRYGKDNPNYGNHKLRGSNHFGCKPVVQLDKNMNLIQEFSYLKEVVNYGYSEEDVRKCCKGRKLKYKGYIWMYSSEYYSRYKKGGSK